MEILICWKQKLLTFYLVSKAKQAECKWAYGFLGPVCFVRAQREQGDMLYSRLNSCITLSLPSSYAAAARPLHSGVFSDLGDVPCPLRSPVQRSQLRHRSASVRPFPSHQTLHRRGDRASAAS